MNETITLWKDYIQGQEAEENKKSLLGDFGGFCHQNYNILYDLIHALDEEKEYENKEYNLTILPGKQSTLIYDMQNASFTVTKLRDYFIAMAGLFTPILPLGSIIELTQKDTESKLFPLVVTHRFLDIEGEKLYIPYGCTPYPMGMQGKGKLIYTTNYGIKTVLRKGFTNEREKEYILLMKQQIILEEGKHSFEFADAGQLKRVRQMIGGNQHE